MLQKAGGDAYAIEAHDLVKTFGDKRAVDGVSLAVPTGSIFGLLGPNGAGKTTTLRMLLGIIDPDSGTRHLLGRSAPLTTRRSVEAPQPDGPTRPTMRPGATSRSMPLRMVAPARSRRTPRRAMVQPVGRGALPDGVSRAVTATMTRR